MARSAIHNIDSDRGNDNISHNAVKLIYTYF